MNFRGKYHYEPVLNALSNPAIVFTTIASIAEIIHLHSSLTSALKFFARGSMLSFL